MLFTWTMAGDWAAPESLVYVRLNGNFSSTIVESTTGDSSASDCRGSKKLAKLHRSPRPPVSGLNHVNRLPPWNPPGGPSASPCGCNIIP